jgi:hypothetical protein
MDDGAGRGDPASPATIHGGTLGELDQIDQAVAAAVTVRYTGRVLTRRSASPSQPGGPTMSGSAGDRAISEHQAGTMYSVPPMTKGIGRTQKHLLVDPALPSTIGHLELLDIPGRWGRADTSAAAPGRRGR